MADVLAAQIEAGALTVRRTLARSRRALAQNWLPLTMLVLLEWALLLGLSYDRRAALEINHAHAAASIAFRVLAAEFHTMFGLAFILTVMGAGGHGLRSVERLGNAVLRRAPAAAVIGLVLNLSMAADIVNALAPPIRRLTDVQLADRLVLLVFGRMAIDVALTAAVGIALALLAAERPGIGATLRRSYRLMRGQRWRFVLLWFGYMAITAAMAFPEIRIGAAASWFRALGVDRLANSAVEAIWFVVIAVFYMELAHGAEAAPAQAPARMEAAAG